MALKAWSEMRNIDVTPYCEERDGMTYLNWAKCIDLLHENGAEKVYWVPIPDEKTGSSLRMAENDFKDSKGNTNRCYETRIKVVIDDNKYEMQSPVMNGTNPVKEFYEPAESMEQYVQVICEVCGDTYRPWF